MAKQETKTQADNPTRKVVNITEKKKRIFIEIPESLHNKFEEIRNSNPETAGKKVNFYSNVFVNGVAASKELIAKNAQNKKEEVENNKEIVPPTPTSKNEQQKKGIPLWLKIVGAFLIWITIRLIIRSRNQD